MGYIGRVITPLLLWTFILSGKAAAQSFEETTVFITEITGVQGFLRALDCKEENRLAMVTPVYVNIPTGLNRGLIEFDHGRENGMTGYSQLDLHDLKSVEYRGIEPLDQSRNYHAIRFTCAGNASCIEKVTFCQGAVAERHVQFSEDTLFFRGASNAERVTKAFNHLLSLLHSKNHAPF